MLTKLYDVIRSFFSRKPVKLAIVRRYADANNNFVGELYLESTFAGVSAYRMIGVSLDSLPLDYAGGLHAWVLDTSHDFLALPMPRYTLRVGAIDPVDNDKVRKMIRRMPRQRMSLIVQNRFIEHVMEPNKI